MGAACVTTPKDQDEMIRADMEPNGKATKQDLLPLSSINLLFDVMSEDIGYDSASLQSYSDQLQSLWIYRVIDVLNIAESTWEQLQIPSVLAHVIRDYLNELKNTKTFTNYASQSHTDIYLTFINKDIRTLFKQLLKSVNGLPSAKTHITRLENILTKQYLLQTDKLKQYMTKSEWDLLNIPTNLKTIICRKIEWKFDGEERDKSGAENGICHTFEVCDEKRDKSGAENEGFVIPLAANEGMLLLETNHCSQSQIQMNECGSCSDEEKEEQMVISNNMQEFSEMINKHINARFTMMDIAKYYSENLLVDDVASVYKHLELFVLYGYHTLYHLSFISDALYDKLLLVTHTPKSLKSELFELLKQVRQQYSDSMSNISQILPFSANVYWEKRTFDAFKMLEEDINLNLEKECNVLMNNFYANVWDWQFLDSNMLLHNADMNGYQKYEIVRIRMQHLMKLCQYQYGQQSIPILPPIWNSQFNENTIIHKLLESTINYNDFCMFHFDGLDWSEHTIDKVKILLKYLDSNFVRKLQFLPIQHRNDNQTWNELVQNENIGKHLRFKINFYALKGMPNSDDLWINAYIRDSFKNVLPQFEQSMGLDIITLKHKQLYNDIERKVICIENMLHYISVFHKITQFDMNDYLNNAQITEMNAMIECTISEIDEMSLNQKFYEIIQLCGTNKLKELKKSKFRLLCVNDISISEFDQDTCDELNEIYDILTEMKTKMYSIPIEDLVILSQTICVSVQWIQTELGKYLRTNM